MRASAAVSRQRFLEALTASPPRWALLADDLTGACDAAAPFAVHGFRAVFALDPASEAARGAELLSLSSESRTANERQAVERTADQCRRIEESGRTLVFKKIDSVLRGHVAAETKLAAEACGFAGAVVCPALPAQGRLVSGGRLYVHGRLADAALPSGDSFETPDAASQSGLERIAHELLARDPAMLPAGSAGLGKAWAAALAELQGRRAQTVRPPCLEAPPVIVSGSNHEATQAQLDYLFQGRIARGQLLAELRDGDFVRAQSERQPLAILVRTRYAEAAMFAPLARALESGEAGGLIVTGGATARVTLENLAASAIEIGGETLPGVPWGRIRGGPAEGAVAVTKSGGFGDEKAFAEVLAMLFGTKD